MTTAIDMPAEKQLRRRLSKQKKRNGRFKGYARVAPPAERRLPPTRLGRTRTPVPGRRLLGRWMTASSRSGLS